MFADAVGVLDRMPTELRSELDERSVVNVYDFARPTDRRMRERDLAPGSPVVERPLVGEHRLLGVPVVNANAMHTDRVIGLPEADSEALLAELFDAPLRAGEHVRAGLDGRRSRGVGQPRAPAPPPRLPACRSPDPCSASASTRRPPTSSSPTCPRTSGTQSK